MTKNDVICELLAALVLAKDMMVANDMSLPRTLEIIDKAIAMAKHEGFEINESARTV